MFKLLFEYFPHFTIFISNTKQLFASHMCRVTLEEKHQTGTHNKHQRSTMTKEVEETHKLSNSISKTNNLDKNEDVDDEKESSSIKKLKVCMWCTLVTGDV